MLQPVLDCVSSHKVFYVTEIDTKVGIMDVGINQSNLFE